MKRRNLLFVVAFCAFVLLRVTACKPAQEQPGGTSTSTPPYSLHVSNGTAVGFYTYTGAYSFGTAANSVFTLTNGASAQTAVNASNSLFYFGSSCASCNQVTYMDAYRGGFAFSSAISGSQVSLIAGATAEGLAVDARNNRLYVSDTTNNTVTILNATLLSPALGGSIAASTFDFQGSTVTSVKYLAVDDINRVVMFTDPTSLKVFFMRATDGSLIDNTGLDLSASCSALSYPVSASVINRFFLACTSGGSSYVVAFSSNGTPNFATGNLATSTYALTGMTTVRDLLYLSDLNYIVAAGTRYITALNASTGSVIVARDATTACGSTVSFSALAYDNQHSLVFASDSSTNKIYSFSPETLAFSGSGGACARSFWTSTAITTPTRLSFY